MKRGELYLVEHATKTDVKKQRVFVVVSRQVVIDSKYSTVICAPVYTNTEGISTQVPVGIDDGLKHQSWIRCDELVSIRKSELTNYVGSLGTNSLIKLNEALKIVLDIE